MEDWKSKVKRRKLCTKVRTRKYRLEKCVESSSESDSESAISSTTKSKKFSSLATSAVELKDCSNTLSDDARNVNDKSSSNISDNGDLLMCSETESVHSEKSSESIDSDESYFIEFSDETCAETETIFNYNETNLSVSFLLKIWAIENKIPKKHLTQLLTILQREIPSLPKSAMTFLKSNVDSGYKVEKFNDTDDKDNAQFVYFRITDRLNKLINPDLHKETNSIQLQFNADGLPLFKSSIKEFWPLICKIHFEPDIYKPFNVATYFGEGKPKSVQKYLSKCIEEINKLLKDGIIVDRKQFKVNVMCFICDRSARGFLKQIKGHTGYYPCERCTTKGERFKNRTIYPSIGCEKRNDKSFRKFEDPEHHNGVSPLISITPHVNMIKQFPLDLMHLACLGVMKKLLVDHWLSGDTKLDKVNVLRLSQRMANLSPQIPCDFQRTTRSLGLINQWKANEFNFFLKYCGPFVLQDILPDHLLQHFLLLYVSFRILSNSKLISLYIENAQIYLERFILLAQQYYGMESEVLNMHSLIHICDDVKNLDCDITKITSYPFENMLAEIKRSLRSGHKPLIHLCNRMSEEDFIHKKAVILPTISNVKRGRKKCVTSLKYKEMELSVRKPNNVVLMKCGSIVKIKKISQSNLKTYLIKGINFAKLAPAFLYPPGAFNEMNIFVVKENNKEDENIYPISEVVSKIIILNIFDKPGEIGSMYAVPLLHTSNA